MTNHPIYIIGKGNLGWHLNELFKSKNLEISGWISSRSSDSFYEIEGDSMVFIAVSDTAIEPIVQKLLKPNNRSILIYCSGSIDLVSKYPHNLACWYPLYSFTKGIQVDWSRVPVFTETYNNSVKNNIENINNLFGIKSTEITATERKKLHVAAVFINNFTTACAIAADTVLKDDSLFSYLMPILNQTLEKITSHNQGNLLDIQTGPAKRGDVQIISEHIELLNSIMPEQHLYMAISKYIQQKNK